MSDVPDCVFASSCPEGIPTLDISLQGDVLDYPRQWGSVARKTDLKGHLWLVLSGKSRLCLSICDKAISRA